MDHISRCSCFVPQWLISWITWKKCYPRACRGALHCPPGTKKKLVLYVSGARGKNPVSDPQLHNHSEAAVAFQWTSSFFHNFRGRYIHGDKGCIKVWNAGQRHCNFCRNAWPSVPPKELAASSWCGESVKKWRSWRTSGSSVNLLCNGTLESHPSTGRRKQQLFGLEWRYIFFTTMTLNCRHCRCVSVQAVFRWPSQKPFNNSLVGDWDTLVGCRSGEKCSASLRLDGNAVDPVDWTKESVGSVKRGQNKTLVWCLSACVSVYVYSVCVCVI